MGALTFARLIHGAHLRFSDKLFIVMRAFFAKPRTRITNPIEHWPGFINDPRLDGTFEMDLGARTARDILLDITAMGQPVGTEFLELFEAQLFDDLVSWGAIGARSSEFQGMRQIGSALAMPPGYKNGTGGNMDVAIDGILTSAKPQVFRGPNKRNQLVKLRSSGNPFGHLILRGSPGKPNFDAEHVAIARQKLQDAGIKTGLGIDFSHANSGKVPKMHKHIADNVALQLKRDRQAIRMVMMESHVIGGTQAGWWHTTSQVNPLVSITDPCEPWLLTLKNLEVLADAVG